MNYIKDKIDILIKLLKYHLPEKSAGFTKYIFAIGSILIALLCFIIWSNNRQSNNEIKSAPMISISIPAENNINKPVSFENTDDSEAVTIVDSAKLDIEILEKAFNPKVAEVAKQAEAAQVVVYPNSDGILTEIKVDDTPAKEQNIISDKIQITPPKLNAEDLTDKETAIIYEEELPEDVYDEKTSQKFLDMSINIERKPPYFGNTPVIAIVIDDMGVSAKRTRDISSLKSPITSSFLTYSKKLDEQIRMAQNSGHEIIAHIPMQAKSNIDVAPDVLTINMTAAEIAINFEHMLDKFPQIKGINNHMGSLFTEHSGKLAPIMDVLRRRQMFFLDSKTSSKSAAQMVARDYAVAYAHRHVFLDNTNEVDYVLKQLKLT